MIQEQQANKKNQEPPSRFPPVHTDGEQLTRQKCNSKRSNQGLPGDWEITMQSVMLEQCPNFFVQKMERTPELIQSGERHIC